jgi:hypothetical protein
MTDATLLTEAERLRPLFSEKKLGVPRRCLIARCGKTLSDRSGNSTLKYHVCRDHPDIADSLQLTHKQVKVRKRQRQQSEESGDESKSPLSQPPSPRPVLIAQRVNPALGIGSPPPLPPHPSLSLSLSATTFASNSSTIPLLEDDEPSILSSESNITPRSSVSLSSSFKTPSPRLRQSSITPFTVPIVRESVAHCFAECFAVHNIPFSLIASPSFHKALNSYRQTAALPPTRRELSSQVFDNVREMKPEVLNRLRACPGVTVGMDGWTNVRHQKVINLVPVANGVAYYWDSVILKKRSTAKEQLPLIQAGLESIIKSGVILAGISFDNEMVNYSLFDLLAQHFPFLIHVPCAAHTIQLLVKSALSLPAVTDALEGLDALLQAYDGNKQVRHALEQLQTTLRPNYPPLKHLLYNATRWSSRLRSIERILSLRACVTVMTEQIIAHLRKQKRVALHRFQFDDHWWQSMMSISKFLKPYQIATDVVQSDSSSLMDIYYQFCQLADAAEQLHPPHPLASMRTEILNQIRVQWLGDGAAHRSHVNVSAVIMCAVFSFDDEYKTHFTSDVLTTAHLWFTRWATQFLAYYKLSDTDDISLIEVKVFQQYADFIGRQGAFRPMDDWVRMARLSSTSPTAASTPQRHQRWNPRRAWQLTSTTAPELTACALALLSLTASEAAVERTFSKQGLLHTKLRNSLSAESVQAQMFVAFNYKALHHLDTDDQGAWVPLADDITTRPRARGIFLSRLPNEALLALPAEPAPPEPAQNEVEMKVEVQPEEAVEELQSEAAQEEDEEEEEEQDEAEVEVPLTQQERLHKFILWYIGEQRITLGHKFTGDRQNTLQQALIDHGITDMLSFVISKIQQHLKDSRSTL